MLQPSSLRISTHFTLSPILLVLVIGIGAEQKKSHQQLHGCKTLHNRGKLCKAALRQIVIKMDILMYNIYPQPKNTRRPCQVKKDIENEDQYFYLW